MPTVGATAALSAVLTVGVWLSQECGSRADRTVDVEVTGESSGAHPAGQRRCRRLVADELCPVTDDLGAVADMSGGEHVGEIGFRAERRPAVLVHQSDSGRGGRGQGGVDVGAAVGWTDPGVERIAGRVVCLTDDQSAVVPARVIASAGYRRQRRGDHSRVTVHPWAVDHPAVRRPVELLTGRRAVLGPPLLIPVRGIDRTAGPLACSLLDLSLIHI